MKLLKKNMKIAPLHEAYKISTVDADYVVSNLDLLESQMEMTANALAMVQTEESR